MNKIRVGVIGCGNIAIHRHLPGYQQNNDVKISAVSDMNFERAKEIAEVYGARAYSNYKELLTDKDIDAVSICTPNAMHASYSIEAMSEGKHVLCEKPMATTLDEAKEMVEVSQRTGKKLMIAHNQRFIPSHQKAKQLIESGAIGKVVSFRTTFGHAGPDAGASEGENTWFFNKGEAGLGVMGDLGVHKVDLLRYMLGQEITKVAAFIKTLAKKQSAVDDNAVCILETDRGVVGTLAASWSYYNGEENATVIYGEKGTLRIEEDPNHPLIALYNSGEIVRHSFDNMAYNIANTEVVRQFIISILKDEVPPTSGDDAFKSLLVIINAFESSNLEKFIDEIDPL